VKRVAVLLLLVGALPYLPDSHRGYSAESRATMRLLLTAQSQTALQPCGCQTKQLGGLARTTALVRKLSREGESVEARRSFVLLETTPKWPAGERAEVVAKTLELLKYDAVVRLDAGDAPAATALRWLKRGSAGAATLLGDKTRIRLYGLVDAETPLPEAKGDRPELHCRLEREPGPNHEAMLVLWPAVAATPDQPVGQLAHSVTTPAVSAGALSARQLREVRVPLRLDGRSVNVVDLERTGDGWQVKWEHVPVDGSAGEDPEVKALVDRYYRQRAHLLATAGEQAEGFWEAKGYADAAQCLRCHEAEHASWQRHRHAGAVKTLSGRERLVSDCLPCHSTLYRQTGKFSFDAPGAGLSVECASCHGDGVLHSLLGRKNQIVRTPTEETCRQCHQGEHDPDFDYTRALKKVNHGDTGNTEQP